MNRRVHHGATRALEIRVLDDGDLGMRVSRLARFGGGQNWSPTRLFDGRMTPTIGEAKSSVAKRKRCKFTLI